MAAQSVGATLIFVKISYVQVCDILKIGLRAILAAQLCVSGCSARGERFGPFNDAWIFIH